MPEMFACLTNSAGGGNTRFSCSTDSIVDDMRFLRRGDAVIETFAVTCGVGIARGHERGHSHSWKH